MALERYDLEGFEEIAPEWDLLAAGSGSPFLTSAWFISWWRAMAPQEGLALVLREDDGTLLAGGCFREDDRGRIAGATSVHTNDWGIVSRDRVVGERFWAEFTELGRRRVMLEPLPEEDGQTLAPHTALVEAGYRVVQVDREASPWLELPDSLDALLAERSRNLRSQVGRRRRRLEREGELTLRVVEGGSTLDEDLDAFFALEASGWKGEGGTGTAIAVDPALIDLYRGFATAAAAGGWLRLYMLELNQRLIAADYGCVFDGCGYLIKTAFDEDLGKLAPGLVLRAAVLESSIDEGLKSYDFLGGPDEYKLRWTDRLRERSALYAWGGHGSFLPYTWRSRIRPRLKRARDLVRSRIPTGGR